MSSKSAWKFAPRWRVVSLACDDHSVGNCTHRFGVNVTAQLVGQLDYTVLPRYWRSPLCTVHGLLGAETMWGGDNDCHVLLLCPK